MSELKFTVCTDKQHVIVLDSYLISAEWTKGAAYAGQAVPFEIQTTFVGQGAKIVIEVFQDDDVSLGKIEDVILNDDYVGKFLLPKNMEKGHEIYFEVELPDNELSGRSQSIPVCLMPIVENLKWSKEEVMQDEELTLTADVHNVEEETKTKITIYEYDPEKTHESVVAIDKKVKDEKIELYWQFHYPGDTEEIPTEKEMEAFDVEIPPPEYFFTVTLGDTEYGLNQESGLVRFKNHRAFVFSV